MIRAGRLSSRPLYGNIAMKQVYKVYEVVTQWMQSTLSEVGFEYAREDLDGPMGSRHLELLRGNEAIRFVWDGKESWFVLEYCADIGVVPYPSWEDIRLERTEFIEPNEEKSNSLVEAFIESIVNIRNRYIAA